MYKSCPTCGKRMRKYREDDDRERVFYICPHCSHRCTYWPRRDAMSDDWPREIFDAGVRDGVVTKEGRAI